MRNPLAIMDAKGVTVARQNLCSRTPGNRNKARQDIARIGSQISEICKVRTVCFLLPVVSPKCQDLTPSR